MLWLLCCAATGLPQELAAEVMQLTLGQPAPGWRLAGVPGSSQQHRSNQGCMIDQDILLWDGVQEENGGGGEGAGVQHHVVQCDCS
jgi:hypothetical protein